MTYDWSQFKVRCSALSKVTSNSRSNPQLTENQAVLLEDYKTRDKLTDKEKGELLRLMELQENSKKVILSDTCIEYLMEAYAWHTEGMVSIKKEIGIDAFERGRAAEEDSITLLSRVDKVLYTKNTERYGNEFLTGEHDVHDGELVEEATIITDVKSCEDFPIFLKKINNGLDPGNKEQVQGYMDIHGINRGQIAYCLPNFPLTMMNDVKRKLFYKGDYVTEESPEFLRKWEKLQHSMTFDQLPPQKRVFKIPIEPFTEIEKQKIYDRVKICREWLFDFDERFQKFNS